MSIWLLSLLASFVLLLAMTTLIWWRHYRLAQQRPDKQLPPCGCSSARADHLDQSNESPHKP